jgi:peptide deformylase
MKLPIVLYGDPVLRVKCKPVTDVTPEIRQLTQDMLETMQDARGVGLAAPQVGVALQLAVIDVSHDPQCVSYVKLDGQDVALSEVMPLIFLNPGLELGKDKAMGEEGCLSIPYVRNEVRRPGAVKVTYTTLDGETKVIESDGLLSRALQHEIDHLNGILFIDRVSAAAKIGLKRKLKRAKEDWEEDIAAGRHLYRAEE